MYSGTDTYKAVLIGEWEAEAKWCKILSRFMDWT
jgi:hypothetical protein